MRKGKFEHTIISQGRGGGKAFCAEKYLDWIKKLPSEGRGVGIPIQNGAGKGADFRCFVACAFPFEML